LPFPEPCIIEPLTAIDPDSETTILETYHVDSADNSRTVLGEVPDLSHPALPDDIFTRLTMHGPFYPPRVETIVNMVRYSAHLNEEQLQKSCELVVKFTDVFALSIQEVKPVDFIKFCLQIPQDATFSKRVHQWPLTKPQREYFVPVLDNMRCAGITCFIPSDEVKPVASTVLVQKAHSGTSLSLEDIHQIVNQQCIALSEPPSLNTNMNLAPIISPEPVDPTKVKWRIFQNFNNVNKVSDVATMPQGDIMVKQQCLVGHKFICVLDFTVGFYAIPVEEESQPFLCFYTEGRGYEAYQRMPMGVHGAPSCFSDLTVQALHDIMVELLLELYVDDGTMAGDIFKELLKHLCLFLLQC
jgi:hypothetical protein